MATWDWPTTAEIGAIFAEEIAEAGGKVTDRFDGGGLLLARSVLPGVREVGRDDRVQGGVAVRATGAEIRVHPYVFRQVCSNGAIMARAIQTRQVVRDDATDYGSVAPAGSLREAIRACCSEEAFAASAEGMRSAREAEADLALMVTPMLATLPPKVVESLIRAIFGRFREERDRSRFGLMNAVTSVARDTRDPDLRWRLEELGGGIPVAAMAPRPTASPARADLVPA